MLTLGSVLVALLPGLPLRTGLRPPLGAPSPSVDVRATAARAPQPLLSAYTPYRRAALEVVEGAAPTDHFVFKTNDVVRIDTDEYAIELFRNRTRTDKLVHKFIEKGCGTRSRLSEWRALSRDEQANHICNVLEGAMDEYAAAVSRDLASLDGLNVVPADLCIRVGADAVWEIGLPADKFTEAQAEAVEERLAQVLRVVPKTRPRPAPRSLSELSVGTVLSPVLIGPAKATGDFLSGAVPKKYGEGYLVDIGLSDASGACLPALLPGFECVLNAANPRGGGGWLNFSNPGMPLGARMQVTSIDGGKVNVSIAAYLRGHAWEQIQTLTENGFPYDATLLSFNEKGAVADVEGLPGFIPWSHWYLPEEKRDMAELEKLKGQTLTVEFLEVDPQRRRLVLSRRKHLLERKRELIAPGQLVEGVVAAIRPYGAVIRLGGELDGFSGLLHISQLSQSYVKNVTQVFALNDFVRSVVIKVDPDDGSIALSTKVLESKAGDMLKDKETLFANLAKEEEASK